MKNIIVIFLSIMSISTYCFAVSNTNTPSGAPINSSSSGGSGSQTPWTSNIDGGGYTLSNVKSFSTGSTGLPGNIRFENSAGTAGINWSLNDARTTDLTVVWPANNPTANQIAQVTLVSGGTAYINWTDLPASGAINWAQLQGNPNGINWIDLEGTLAARGINWADLRNIVATDINWADNDVYGNSFTAHKGGNNTFGATVFSGLVSFPTTGINWVGLKASSLSGGTNSGINWADFGY